MDRPAILKPYSSIKTFSEFGWIIIYYKFQKLQFKLKFQYENNFDIEYSQKRGHFNSKVNERFLCQIKKGKIRFITKKRAKKQQEN